MVRYSDADDLATRGAEADVLVPGFRPTDTTRRLLQELPRLRLVQLRSAGAERWLDVVPAGVAVSDCRGAHGALTAEWVLAALLALLRDLPRFVRSQQSGQWERDHDSDTLVGKRVLLIGAGDVAQGVERRLFGFDIAGLTMVGRTARPGVQSRSQLSDLLPTHDIVVLLAPMTHETERMVDARFLAAMPDGAVLVNASRGELVDTTALTAELRSRRLRAVLDVVDPNPLPAGHPLWDLPNVLITPHVAGIGTRSRWAERAYSVIREQLTQVAAGRDPENLVRNGY